MKNECFNVALVTSAGAVIAFFACLGYFTRAAYLSGFAEGFTAARDRFKRIIKKANARDIFKAFEDDIDADGAP